MSNIASGHARTLIAIYISVLLIGCLFGITMPLLSLRLELMGASKSINGLSAAIGVSSMLIMAPFIPRILSMLGTKTTMVLACLVASLALSLFPLFPDIFLWFPIRLIFGLALTALFTCSETWLNLSVPAKNRGLMLGLYGTILSVGFSLGPFLLGLTGMEGSAPFTMAASMTMMAGFAIFLLTKNTKTETPDKTSGLVLLWLRHPTPFLAAFLFGGIETGIFTLLPVHATMAGLEAAAAAQLLVAVGVGNVAMQLPIGWLADRVNNRLLLGLCALSGLAGGIALLVLDVGSPVMMGWLVFWGGAVVGFYTVGLSMLVKTSPAELIPSMNAGFLTMYGLGAVTLPSASGLAMDYAGLLGLPIILILICASYLMLLSWRWWRQSQINQRQRP